MSFLISKTFIQFYHTPHNITLLHLILLRPRLDLHRPHHSNHQKVVLNWILHHWFARINNSQSNALFFFSYSLFYLTTLTAYLIRFPSPRSLLTHSIQSYSQISSICFRIFLWACTLSFRKQHRFSSVILHSAPQSTFSAKCSLDNVIISFWYQLLSNLGKFLLGLAPLIYFLE